MALISNMAAVAQSSEVNAGQSGQASAAKPGGGGFASQSLIWVMLGAIVVAYAPMLSMFFQQLWYVSHSSFLVFTPFLVGWLFYSRWSWGRAAPDDAARKVNWLAWSLAIVAAVVLLLSILLYNPWLSAVSVVILAASLLLVATRYGRAKYQWGIWALLWLMVPLPLGMDQRLISELQLLSSQISGLFLDILGIVHEVRGNTLGIAAKQLFVDEACSGIVSLTTIIAGAAAYGVYENRHPVYVVILILGAAFFAVLMNTVRISSIVIGLEWLGIDLSEGLPHEILGLCLFGVTFGMVLSLDHLIQWCVQLVLRRDVAEQNRLAVTPKRVDLPTAGKSSSLLEPILATLSRLGIRGTVVGGYLAVFAPIALVQCGLYAQATISPVKAVDAVPLALAMDGQSMPPAVEGLTLVKFVTAQRERDDIFGEHSRTYTYIGAGGQPYLLSFDFPFGNGWHELLICYTGAGWNVQERRTLPIVTGSGTIVEATMSNKAEQHSYVTWTLFDEYGQVFSPPAEQWKDQIWRLVVRRNPLTRSKQLFQMQVFIPKDSAVTQEQQALARALLLAATERAKSILIGSK